MSVTLRLFGRHHQSRGPDPGTDAEGVLLREDLGLFAIVRGAGGQDREAVASRLALATLEQAVAASVEQTLARADRDPIGLPEQAKRLSLALHQAHAKLLAEAEEQPHLRGLSASVTAFLESPRERELHIAHVGDGRCYRLRHGRLECLTRDDTLAEEILSTRPGTPQQVLQNLPHASVVRALGLEQSLRISVTTISLIADDRFLLSSVGMHRAIPPERLGDLLRLTADRSHACQELARAARQGGEDAPATALVVDVREVDTQEEHSTRPYNERPEQ